MAKTYVLPALVEQLRRFAEAQKVLNAGRGKAVLESKTRYLSDLLGRLEEGITRAGDIITEDEKNPDLESAVKQLGEVGAAALEGLRCICDEIEKEIDADLWKLPTYTQMLHLH